MICSSVKRFFMFVFFSENDFTRFRLALFVGGRSLDESGNATSADLGHAYRKLLCIAFDLAVLRAHLDDEFPRFVYHDGVLESLDDRKKENL